MTTGRLWRWINFHAIHESKKRDMTSRPDWLNHKVDSGPAWSGSQPIRSKSVLDLLYVF